MSAVIPFTKASACGNDFLIIEGMHAPADMAAFTRRICERHSGIGADGVEWLFPDQKSEADVRARLFNADGSEAEISGNGTRCVAAYWIAQHGGDSVSVRTGAGIKDCALVSSSDGAFQFRTNMGVPMVGEQFPIKVAFGEVQGVPVSMGNPHFVVFVDDFGPGWQGEAAEIGKHHDFKYGINVEFVRSLGEHGIQVRFFERGVGETLSSGTGSCAAAVAAIASGKSVSPVEVRAPGGSQTVEWQSLEDNVLLTGPAELICRGEFFV
jgi:diaminopimelate epimerase